MNGVIVDYRTDKKILDELKKMNLKLILSMNNKEVSSELSGHPDMQICKCSEDVFVCCPSCYEYYKNELSCFNANVICGKTNLSCNYPGDVAYNVAWIGDSAVHNLAYTDEEIIEYFQSENINLINVMQGYSKCNICCVSSGAVITSDEGVCCELLNNNVDTLLIRKGYIDIFGWDYGFVGGASGKIGDDVLAFFGDIKSHPDYKKIELFCKKYNTECVSLSKERLMDYGSLVFVKNQSA